MKILLIHNFYQQFGGEDAVALAEQRLLEQQAEDVVVYSRHNDDIKSYGVAAKAKFGVETIFSRRTNHEIREVVRRCQPDVAYVHNVFPLISPAVYHALHALRVPTVQVIHDFRFLCPNGWFYTQGRVCERCKSGQYWNAVRRRCYRGSYLLSALYATAVGANRLAGIFDKITAFICLTEFAKHKLVEARIPERKIFIRPNFLDATTTTPTPGQGHHVVYLGRLSAEKGVWTLVRAFEQLPDVTLKIVGTGPLEAALHAYVRERHLTNVHFAGFQQGAEKQALLRESVGTVVPSEWYENFPVVVLEAYAAGKPVIGANIGSLPYVIENERSGLLFEVGNPRSLADKVRELVNDPAKRAAMENYARTLVDNKYSPRESYRTLKTIFTQVQGLS